MAKSKPKKTALAPLQAFLHDEAAGGIVLVLAALAALVWANSPASDSYASLWGHYLTLGWGPAAVTENLQHWVNDGLMVVFFFVVGLEIKRELAIGELRDVRVVGLDRPGDGVEVGAGRGRHLQRAEGTPRAAAGDSGGAGRGARGDRRAAHGAVLQHHVDLDRRVASAVQDLPGGDVDDLGHAVPRTKCGARGLTSRAAA